MIMMTCAVMIGVPPGLSRRLFDMYYFSIPHPAGDHKGPPNPTSATLAPTESSLLLPIQTIHSPPPGDHKGPPNPSSSTLAPTFIVTLGVQYRAGSVCL